MSDGTRATATIATPPDAARGPREPAVHSEISGTLRRGSAWSLAGYAGTQLLRFGGNLALTRLLLPEAFGVMALVNALLIGLQLFSDVGIGPSIIQSPRGADRDFLNTAWTVQVLRGGVLFLVAVLLAAPLAGFYAEPLLAQIVPVAGLSALIAGFNSTRIFSAYRRVDLARVSLLELGSQAVALAAMIGLALHRPTIWALVAGGLAGALAKLALSHTLLPGERNRFRWDKSALGQMVAFGRWIFASTLLTFFVGQSDRLVFGALIPLALLGVYSVASMLAGMPALALGRMASSVCFPVYSRVHEAGQDLAPVFRRVRTPLLVLGGWMTAGLVGGGEAAVRLFYDQRYAEAGWILQVLALGAWFAVLEATHAAALLARGQARMTAASSAAKLAGMLVLIPLGYRAAGFPGAVAALSASELLRYGVSAFAAARAGLRGWPQDLRLTAWVGASAALVAAGAHAARDAHPALGAGLVLVLATLAWAPLGAPYLVKRARGD